MQENTPCALFAVRTDRDEWIDRAERQFSRAKDGHSRRRRRGRKRGPLAFVFNAPKIHLEYESAQYQRAAEAFRICGGRWLDCADAYARAAFVQAQQVRCPETAAALYAEAAAALEKADPVGAVRYLAKAISHYCEVEKYGLAGYLQKRSARLYDSERDYPTALELYLRASNYFVAADMPEQSHNVLTRAAYLMGWTGHYHKSALLYSSLGKNLLESNLTKRAATNMFFCSGLLYLALGSSFLDEAEEKLKDFAVLDYHFKTSREVAFLEQVIESIRTGDLARFSDQAYFFDSVCSLDVWCLKLLDRVRQSLEGPK